MGNSKLYFFVSFTLLGILILSFSELYLFSKGMSELPEWAKALPHSSSGGHLLSVLAFFPIVFLTSDSKFEVKNLAIVVLLAPLLAVSVLGLNNDQMLAFIAVNYLWVVLVNTLPVSIFLIACHFEHT